MDVAIINYGVSNLYSVQNILEKNNVNSIITNDNDVILNAKIAILPGVGAFGESMKKINYLKLDQTIMRFIDSGKPFFSICLGMHLLFQESYEFGHNRGLGILEGQVKLLTSNQNNKFRVPHVGWNKVFFNTEKYKKTFMKHNKNEDFMYFVHSYYVKPEKDEIKLTTTKYEDIEFCSSVNKENITAFQFHPEKSGNSGGKIFKFIKKYINNNE